MTTDHDVRAILDGLGIEVPAGDLPFLQRTKRRQEELVSEWSRSVSPETEPALVFKVRTPI